jgi:hypothetical protein
MMSAMQKVITRTTLKAASRDRAYWLTRTVEERIAAVEVLRRQALAANADAEQRLQRVCRITQLHRR